MCYFIVSAMQKLGKSYTLRWVIFQDMSNEQKVIAMLNGYEENDETLLTNTVRFIHTMVQQYLNGSP